MSITFSGTGTFWSDPDPDDRVGVGVETVELSVVEVSR